MGCSRGGFWASSEGPAEPGARAGAGRGAQPHLLSPPVLRRSLLLFLAKAAGTGKPPVPQGKKSLKPPPSFSVLHCSRGRTSARCCRNSARRRRGGRRRLQSTGGRALFFFLYVCACVLSFPTYRWAAVLLLGRLGPLEKRSGNAWKAGSRVGAAREDRVRCSNLPSAAVMRLASILPLQYLLDLSLYALFCPYSPAATC